MGEISKISSGTAPFFPFPVIDLWTSLTRNETQLAQKGIKKAQLSSRSGQSTVNSVPGERFGELAQHSR